MWYTLTHSSEKGDRQITRAGGRRATVADAAFGLRRVKSLGNLKLVKTLNEDTAVRAVSPPSVFLYGFIRGTSLEAVGGGVLFPCRIRRLSTEETAKEKADEESGAVNVRVVGDVEARVATLQKNMSVLGFGGSVCCSEQFWSANIP